MTRIEATNATQGTNAESISLQQSQKTESNKSLFSDLKNQPTQLEKTLTKYGIELNLAQWIGVVDAQEVDASKSPDKCKSLCLTSSEGFQIYIPLDNKVHPGDVVWYRAEDEANIHFENFKGTVVVTSDEFNPGFSFDNGCNVKVHCKDGIRDYIAFSNGGAGEVITTDYADVVRTSEGDSYKETKLSPGVHRFNTEG